MKNHNSLNISMQSGLLMFNSLKRAQPSFRKARPEERPPLPGLLQPLVKSIGVLRELLTQLVIFFLPPLLLLQLQLPLLCSTQTTAR